MSIKGILVYVFDFEGMDINIDYGAWIFVFSFAIVSFKNATVC